MQDEESIDPADRELAESLRGLQPAAATAQASPQRIWYEAGFQAGRRRANVWRAVAAMIALVAGAAIVWQDRSVPSVSYVNRGAPAAIVNRAPSAADESSSPVLSAAYLKLRDAVVQDGWKALPPPSGRNGEPPLRAWQSSEQINRG